MPLSYEFFRSGTGREHARWAADRIPGCGRGWEKCVVLRVFDDQTRGVVVFHDWNPEAATICMSAAGNPGWLNRSVLYAIHNYIFNDAGCQLAIMQVSENNTVMNRIARAYGYRDHIIPRLRGPNEAEIIWTLTDDDWRNSRFHRSNHGQANSTRTA